MNVATAGTHQLPTVNKATSKTASAPSSEPRLPATVKAATNVQSGSTGPAPSLPPRIGELVTQYRVFGSEIWPERRRLFERLLAASELAQQRPLPPQHPFR